MNERYGPGDERRERPEPGDPREGPSPPPGSSSAPLERALGDVPGRTRDDDVWNALAIWRAERRRFALATVVASRGFTPRKPGAHMLIAPEGTTVGTVGGGAIEREVLDHARQLLETGGVGVVKRHLTQELGMCCGGEMTVFLEVLDPAPRLFVFGAGYIAKPLAAIAAGCGFAVTVVDERAEWATPERFPTSEIAVRDPESFARALETTAGDYAAVMTHDHALDQRIVQALLRRPLRFVGMIGSIPKQRKFAQRLRARGFSEGDVARLHTPLGVSIGASTPEEIAVSVMAELIAVRRGAPAPSSAGWPHAEATAKRAAPRGAEPIAEPAGVARSEGSEAPDPRASGASTEEA